MNRSRKRATVKVMMILSLTVVLASWSATTAFAQAAAKSSATDDGYAAVQVAGQQVAIDRATGKLRQPTPQEAKALAAGLMKFLNRSSAGLTAVQHPNGATSMDLQGRYLSVSVAKVNPDGTVSEKCVTSIKAAKNFVGRTTAHPQVTKAGSKRAGTGKE
jgi:hypothetical protein